MSSHPSFQQRGINLANERLQQFFIASVFAAERKVYEAENLDPSCVVFEDNAAIIAIIDNEKSKDADGNALLFGILKHLNGVCNNPSGTDQSFLSDCKSTGYDAKLFEPGSGSKANEQFILIHTSGRVEYEVADFREKNMENLMDKQVELLSASTMPLLAELFQMESPKGFTGQQFKRPHTRTQL